jgi:prevent-host-death family protein
MTVERRCVHRSSEHMFVHSTNHKGAVAEAMIAAHAIKHGIAVLRPVAEHSRYDLAFDLGERIIRIQCKWGALDQDARIIRVRIGGSRHTPNGYVLSSYSPEEIDALAIYCEPLDTVYLLPVEAVDGQKYLHLRLAEPRNFQRACINLASDYEFAGAVAQLGRALRWQRRGRGFESHQLHSSRAPTENQVGAHEFREKFGYWMDRAARGDEILITRRGRRYARLGPPDPQLASEIGPLP